MSHVVLLVTSCPSDRVTETNQRRAIDLLHARHIRYSEVDACLDENRDRRERLFEISGLRTVYPQFFVVEDDVVEDNAHSIVIRDDDIVEECKETERRAAAADDDDDSAAAAGPPLRRRASSATRFVGLWSEVEALNENDELSGDVLAAHPSIRNFDGTFGACVAADDAYRMLVPRAMEPVERFVRLAEVRSKEGGAHQESEPSPLRK